MKSRGLRRAVNALFSFTNTRTRIMGIVVGLVLLLGLWTTVLTYVTLRDNLRSQLTVQGVSIARYIAARSVDLVFTHDMFALHELVTQAVENDQDVRYVFILDADGNLIGNSFGDVIPVGLVEINPLGSDEVASVKPLLTEEGLVYDVAVPIFEGRAGTVRVGISTRRIEELLLSTTKRLLLATLFVGVLGILAAYFLTSILTRPIGHLVETAKAVGDGDLTKRVPLWEGRDELRELGSAFNEMIDRLERAHDARSSLLKKLIRAQEEERRRIARELHDETSQSLTSLAIGLKMVEDSKSLAEVRERVTELRALVGTVLDEIHDLSLALRPSALDDLGLKAAVERFALECARKTGIKIDFQSFGIDGLRLSPEIEITIYRVIQEALTNVLRHAQASEVSVILERKNGVLTAIVEDNGVGFDVEAVLSSPLFKEKRLGLHGMSERVNLIGGDLTIESAPGRGTTIYVHIGLREGLRDHA